MNQEVSNNAQSIEIFLKNDRIRERINTIDDVIKYCDGVHQPSKLFKLVELDDRIISTSITNEAFTVKNDAINNCRRTLSDMQRMLEPNNRTR